MQDEVKVITNLDEINAERHFEENKDKPFETNVLGINVDIGAFLGEKIVDQVMAKLTPNEMDAVVDYVISDLFTKDSYDPDKIRVLTKNTDKTRTTCYVGSQSKLYLSDILKAKVNAALHQSITDECIKIIESDEYKEKAKKIADELIEYATEGYKEEMKQRIYERMVGNTINSELMINHKGLKSIIREELDKFSHAY